MVSKSEQFSQPSSAFGRAGSARSARRHQFEQVVGPAPAGSTKLPVALISQNPDNPRDHMRDLSELTQTVREVGVVNAITVATVDAYLKERPTQADRLDPGTTYIVIDGHRRLEACRQIGIDTIKVTVDNALVSTDESLLEAAFISNYHRDGMTELEEANALEKLVKFYGGQSKASKRLGIAQSTISTKLSYLKLSPELQSDLAEGRRPAEQVRNLGKLSPEKQRAQADARAEEARQRSAKPRVSKQAQPSPSPTSEPQNYHAVIIAAPDAPSPVADEPAPEGAPEGATSRALPEPRAQLSSSLKEEPPVPAAPAAAERPPVKMPWHDGRAAMDIIFRKLSVKERRIALGRYVELVGGAEEAAADLTEVVTPQVRKQLAQHLTDGL
ncbi:ParB/RepB/Spo0J family partition protein [Streptomyces sp. NPDC057496]|uniref:ParB/RepB/Spo0J family partition protein n=1 Tax=Streptomyces sp. NPDC057496 TaxID=3346149 RepID=UPI0036BAC4CD